MSWNGLGIRLWQDIIIPAFKIGKTTVDVGTGVYQGAKSKHEADQMNLALKWLQDAENGDYEWYEKAYKSYQIKDYANAIRYAKMSVVEGEKLKSAMFVSDVPPNAAKARSIVIEPDRILAMFWAVMSIAIVVVPFLLGVLIVCFEQNIEMFVNSRGINMDFEFWWAVLGLFAIGAYGWLFRTELYLIKKAADLDPSNLWIKGQYEMTLRWDKKWEMKLFRGMSTLFLIGVPVGLIIGALMELFTDIQVF